MPALLYITLLLFLPLFFVSGAKVARKHEAANGFPLRCGGKIPKHGRNVGSLLWKYCFAMRLPGKY
jgi:hypothetical protein